MEVEYPPMIDYEVTEQWAGPSDELDKIEAINWRAISSACPSGMIADFVEMRRTGPNALEVDFFISEPLG